MTLAQLLGNYGEFVGAIAVVATLLYLAVQIRHSGTQTEIQNEQSQYEQWNTALLLPASSPQVSDLCVRGRPSRSELSEGERLQFDTILTVAINAIEHAYRRSEDPESDPDSSTWVSIARFWLEHPGGIEFWESQRGLFYQGFSEWVDAQLGFKEMP